MTVEKGLLKGSSNLRKWLRKEPKERVETLQRQILDKDEEAESSQNPQHEHQPKNGNSASESEDMCKSRIWEF